MKSLVEFFWSEYFEKYKANKCLKCPKWEKCQKAFNPAMEAGAHFIMEILNAISRSIESKYGVPADEVRTLILDTLAMLDGALRLKKLEDVA